MPGYSCLWSAAWWHGQSSVLMRCSKICFWNDYSYPKVSIADERGADRNYKEFITILSDNRKYLNVTSKFQYPVKWQFQNWYQWNLAMQSSRIIEIILGLNSDASCQNRIFGPTMCSTSGKYIVAVPQISKTSARQTCGLWLCHTVYLPVLFTCRF